MGQSSDESDESAKVTADIFPSPNNTFSMSRHTNQRGDLERGNERDARSDTQSPQNQSLQGESNFGDSSGPFFSIYSKAADVEDNKMVEQWQNDADGILLFTGLFSAAVAQLLSITVPDLRSNSQDTSAFYLGNIYEVLANPNATHASIPSPIAPPPFSPPTYAIWVNSLWFLSFVISLTCALLATSVHQWSRRYIAFTQPAWCGPEKRARMRAFFAEGADKMHIPLAVEALPMLLHLSVFLFFGGLVIFLFNVDHKVFSSVMPWIGLFSTMYGLITVMPIVRHNSPYYAPPSQPVWYLYAGMKFVLFKVLASKFGMSGTFGSWGRFSVLRDHYHYRILGGLKKAVEKMVADRSPELDIRIFDWTMRILGEDDSVEKFFEAVPGFFSSKLVNHLESDFPEVVLNRFWSALNRFMDRTLSSESVIESVKARRVKICRDITSKIPFPQISIERRQTMARWRVYVLESTFDALGEDSAWEEFFESVPGFFDSEVVDVLKEHLPGEFRIKFSQALNRFLDRTLSISSESVRSRRLITCLKAAHAALGSDRVSHILWEILNSRWPELLQSVEIGHSLRSWSNAIDEQFIPDVRRIVAQIVIGVQQRNDRWISLVRVEFGVPDRDLRKYIADGDSVLLSILIHVARQAHQTGSWIPALSSLSAFNIHDTLPRLQHTFCALWNEILVEAMDRGEDNAYVKLLREIRGPYIDLHQDTEAALTFPAATNYFDPVLTEPFSYRYCNIASHRQDSSVHTPSLIFPSFTPPDQSPAPSQPHSSPIDGVHTPDGGSASQQTEEENVFVEPPSSPDHTPDPSHTQGLTPLFLATHFIHAAQANSSPSVSRSITRDSDRLGPGEPSRDPSQSASSSAATDYVRSDDPTTLIHTGESGERYQDPVTSLLFEHVLAPTTITPPTGPDPGIDSDTPQDTTSSAILSRPLEGNRQQDTVTSREARDISENPSAVNPIPRSIPAVSTIVATEPLSPPHLLLARSSGMTAAGPLLSVESSQIQPDHPQSSSIETTSSQISTQAAPAIEARVASRIVMSNLHDDNHDLDPPSPMTLFPQTAVPAHDMIATTLPLEDQVQHDPDGQQQ